MTDRKTFPEMGNSGPAEYVSKISFPHTVKILSPNVLQVPSKERLEQYGSFFEILR
jgi:hypothetical protein